MSSFGTWCVLSWSFVFRLLLCFTFAIFLHRALHLCFLHHSLTRRTKPSTPPSQLNLTRSSPSVTSHSSSSEFTKKLGLKRLRPIACLYRNNTPFWLGIHIHHVRTPSACKAFSRVPSPVCLTFNSPVCLTFNSPEQPIIQSTQFPSPQHVYNHTNSVGRGARGLRTHGRTLSNRIKTRSTPNLRILLARVMFRM